MRTSRASKSRSKVRAHRVIACDRAGRPHDSVHSAEGLRRGHHAGGELPL